MTTKLERMSAAELLAFIKRLAAPPERNEQPGSRHRWPICGAMTKGNPSRKRTRAICKAAGAGFGGRCRHHGGLAAGNVFGNRSGGKRGTRRVVLFSQFAIDDLFEDPRDVRRWHMAAVPLDLLDRIGGEHHDGEFELARGGMEAGRLSLLLVTRGDVRRDKSMKWPQRLGFRIVQLLAERGRIAFCVFHDRRDIFRSTRVDVGDPERTGWKAFRVETDELLAALYAAGARPSLPPQPKGFKRAPQAPEAEPAPLAEHGAMSTVETHRL